MRLYLQDASGFVTLHPGYVLSRRHASGWVGIISARAPSKTRAVSLGARHMARDNLQALRPCEMGMRACVNPYPRIF